MAEIRPLTAEDLPAVTALLDAELPTWGGDAEFLRVAALEHPWADPDLPSLVASDDGVPVGFIASQVRRVRFDDRELRGVCCSHLVVAPDQRDGAVGVLLFGSLVRGPQDLTWTDSANAIVARMWQAFGGVLDHSRACDWMLVLRPAAWLGGVTRTVIGRQGRGELSPVAAIPAHALARRSREEAPSDVTGAPAAPGEVADALPDMLAKVRVRVDYDREHLEHLLGLIGQREREVVCRLVRRGDRVIGWYVYVVRRGRVARVLQLCAKPPQTDAVLTELADHARASGCRVLAGRLEPNLDSALRERGAAIGFARQPALHAADPELRATLATGSSLLTQLDSEWFVT